MKPYLTCVVCRHYAERRDAVLSPEVALRAFIRGVHPDVVAHEFLFAVHERHLAGGSLSTRRRTPHQENGDGSTTVHVSRVCNGCGSDLGDVNEDELDASLHGYVLPDVRLECGCWTEAAA